MLYFCSDAPPILRAATRLEDSRRLPNVCFRARSGDVTGLEGEDKP